MDGGSAARLGACCAVAATAGVLLGGACGDSPHEGPLQIRPLEQAICHKLLECGCSESLSAHGLQPPLDCNGWTFESLLGEGPPYYYGGGYGYEGGYDPDEPPLPMTFDEECVERLADATEAAGCDTLAIRLSCEEFCLPYFGPGLEGQPCEDPYACGRGLVCAQFECRNPCSLQPAGEGERCDTVGCQPGLACGLGLLFDFPTCLRLPGPGEPCDMGDCAAGSWCDDSLDEPRCTALGAIGAQCSGHGQCETRWCPAGRCADRPSVGMPCPGPDTCAPGAECIQDPDGDSGTCIRAPQVCQATVELIVNGP